MPALEQQHPTDRVPPPSTGPSIGLQSVQHETWGPQAVNVHPSKQTNSVDAFGHLKITSSTQSDWLRDWCAKPFSEFQPPAGVKIAEKELEHSQGSLNEHALAVEVATVKAVYAVGNSVVGIGNLIVSPPARLGNWLANTIKDPATANSDAAKSHDDVDKTVKAGDKVLHAVGAYAESVKQAQEKGDYSKPLVDAGNGLHTLTNKFKKLNPAQQTEAVSEQAVSLGIQIATGKILASAPEAFASLMEKMDAFKIKADGARIQFGIEEKLTGEANHFAGARNRRFNYEEIDSVRSYDIPIQCHENACVAAVGEMLTKGAIDQRTLVGRLELYLNPEQRGKESVLSLLDLSKELGSKWEFKTVSTKRNIEPGPLLKQLLSGEQPFAVTLKRCGVEAHAVVVDGINEAGRLVIKDPGDGKMYQMEMKDFHEYWTGQAVAKAPKG